LKIAKDTERRKADNELRQFATRLQLAAKSAGMGIWDWDIKNNHLSWDRGMCGLYDIAGFQFGSTYDGWITRLHPDDKLQIDQEIQWAIQGKKNYDTEFRIIWTDGSIHSIKATGIVERDEDGLPNRMIGANWDITSQKLTEERLIKAKRLYTFISQINQTIVRIKDEQELFRAVCSIAFEFGTFKIAWIGLFDARKAEISLVHQNGIPAGDLGHFRHVPLKTNGPQEYVQHSGKYFLCNNIAAEPGLAGWHSMALKYGIHSCVILPVTKSGKIIGTFNLYAATPNFYDNEEIALLQEVTGDISFALDAFEKAKKHQQAEELVLHNEKLFRALIENNADMITLGNRAGKLIYGSPSVTVILGYSQEELINKSLFDIIHPDELVQLMESRSELLKNPGKSSKFQHRRRHKGGGWVWCEGTFTNMLDEPGINAIVTNFRDISEKKSAELQQEFDRNNLDALINNTNDLMWSVDLNFNLITSNQPFNNILKLTTGQRMAKGDNVLKTLSSPEQAEPYKNLYQRAFNGESFTEVIYNELPVDSWAEISYCPIRKGDEVIGAGCHSRDITAKIKTEGQLRRSEIFNRGVLNSLSSHIAVIDGLGNIVAVNEAWTRFALENGETTLKRTGVGSNYFEVCEKAAGLGDKIAAIACSGIKDVMDGNQAVFYLEYPCHSPGRQRWFGMRVTKFDSDEKMVVVAHHDISERKLAEENLSQSESRLKEAQAIAHIGNFEVDLSNYSVAWSDEMYRIFGITREEGLPSTELFLSFIHPDDVISARHRFGEGTKDPQDVSFNFRFIRKDGALRFGCTEARYEFDNNQNHARLFGILQDITNRKLAEIERTKMVNDMMLRNSELEQFGYIISHNLRAPVANIIGASNVLNDPGLSVADRKMINKGINTSVTRLDNVVKDLNHILEVKGDINQTQELVHFSSLVDDIKISIQNLIDEHGVQIRCDFSAIDVFITFKPYLYSIFYNLISNSIKYRREGVDSMMEIKSSLQKNKLELSFTDNGLGIDLKKNGADVFGLYKRFHSNIEGKGMGLFMVKTQVEALGGKISVQSAENEGSEFKIEFDHAQ